VGDIRSLLWKQYGAQSAGKSSHERRGSKQPITVTYLKMYVRNLMYLNNFRVKKTIRACFQKFCLKKYVIFTVHPLVSAAMATLIHTM
jgi:hypothetical protein